MRKKIYYLIIGLVCCSINSIAQTNENASINKIFPVSPQAASLGQYGEIPIDLCTGKINYTIPIYTIKVGDFEYPIQLSYNYNGYRPEDIPSNVGYGWSINTSGYISTQVRGLCDFSARGYQNTANDNLIPYLTGRWYNQLSPSQAIERTKLYLRLSDEGQIDNEPDKFVVNVGKLGFSFYLDENAKAFCLPKSNNTVKLGYNNLEPFFDITDDLGNFYKFGLVEKTENQGSSLLVDIANSGYNLTEIITKTKSSILFSYTPKYRNVRSYTNTLKRCVFNDKRPPSGITGTSLQQNDSFISYNQIKDIKFIDGRIEFLYDNNIDSQDSRLEYIVVKNNQDQIVEKYQFLYSSEKKLLLKVNKISNASTINIGEFDYYGEFPSETDIFSNDYWGYYNGKNNSSYLTGNHSLNLDATLIGALKTIKYPTKGKSIIEYEQNEALTDQTNVILDCSKTEFQKHSELTARSYRSNNFQSFNLERRINIPFKQTIKLLLVANSDVTRVHNGEAIARVTMRRNNSENFKVLDCQNNNLRNYNEYDIYSFRDFNLPGIPVAKLLYIDCEPGEIILSLEVSNMIEGESFASFSVDYDDTVVVNTEIGGLRIKKVTTLTDNSSTISREFSYVKDDGTTSGTSAFTTIKKYTTTINLTSPNAMQVENGYGLSETWKYENIVGQSCLPFANYNGNPVIYSQVTEKFSSLNNNKGYIVHKFTGDIQGLGRPIDGLINLPLDNTYISLGKKIDDKTYDNLSKCIKSVNTSYLTINDSDRKINGLKIFRPVLNLGYIQNPGSLGVMSDNYQLTEFSSISEFNTYPYSFKEYSYLPLEVKNVNFFNSNPIETKTQFLYNSNHLLKNEKTYFDNNNFKETNYFYPQDSQMATKPFVNELKAANIVGVPLETQTLKNGQLLSKQETVYAKDATTNNLLLPKTILAAKGTQTPETKITYNSYDDKGNVTQYTPEGGIPVAVIWGYNQTVPIAKIENASYAQVQSYVSNLQTLSNGTDENALIVALNSLRTNLPAAMVTTYTHKPLVGVSTITDAKGNKVTYTYDSFNRLESVKDHQGNTINENEYHYRPN
ncbi:MAG: RHS repeat protein [Limnohabitans sp.]|nr:RHS repeat protein [Limnohabitans sp.]